MIKRIFNFCWSHLIVNFPIVTLLFIILEFQKYFPFLPKYDAQQASLLPFVTFFIYYSANIEILQLDEIANLNLWITKIFLPLVPLISYPFVIKYLNEKMKIIILCILYPFLVFTNDYLASYVGYLILQAFGLTIRDYYIRQKKGITPIKRNNIKLNFIDLLERNIVKVVCLSFFIVTFIYYFIKKEVLWDKICDTVVE